MWHFEKSMILWYYYICHIVAMFLCSHLDDCFWDFAACKRINKIGSSTIFRNGRMINRRNPHGRDQTCCQNRYHRCCAHVTGSLLPQDQPTTTEKTTTTTEKPITPRSVCPKSTPSKLSKCVCHLNINQWLIWCQNIFRGGKEFWFCWKKMLYNNLLKVLLEKLAGLWK